MNNRVQYLVCKHSSCSVYYAMSSHAYRKLANCFCENVHPSDIDFRYKVFKGFNHDHSWMFINYIPNNLAENQQSGRNYYVVDSNKEFCRIYATCALCLYYT